MATNKPCEIPSRPPASSASDPTTVADLTMPPPGVGIEEVRFPVSGSQISIVLTPQKKASSDGDQPSYSIGSEGVASIGVIVVQPGGRTLSGAASHTDVENVVAALNADLPYTLTLALQETVSPSAPGPNAAASVMVDGMLGLKYAGEGIGTIVWGYNISLSRLMELAPERFHGVSESLVNETAAKS